MLFLALTYDFLANVCASWQCVTSSKPVWVLFVQMIGLEAICQKTFLFCNEDGKMCSNYDPVAAMLACWFVVNVVVWYNRVVWKPSPCSCSENQLANCLVLYCEPARVQIVLLFFLPPYKSPWYKVSLSVRLMLQSWEQIS